MPYNLTSVKGFDEKILKNILDRENPVEMGISRNPNVREVQEKQEKSLQNYAENMARKLENSKNNTSDNEEIQPRKFTPEPTILEDFVDMSQYRKPLTDERISELFEIKPLSENRFKISTADGNFEFFDLKKERNGELRDNSSTIMFELCEFNAAIHDRAEAEKVLNVAKEKCAEFSQLLAQGKVADMEEQRIEAAKKFEYVTVSEEPQKELSAEDLAKIAQNEAEDRAFKKQLAEFISSPPSRPQPLVIGTTPNALLLANANPALNMVI